MPFPLRVLAIFLTLTLTPTLAMAASDEPDPGFGTDGVYVFDLPGLMDNGYALGAAPGGGYLVLASNETQGDGYPMKVHRVDADGIGHSESANVGSGFADAAFIADDGRVLRARQPFSGPLLGVKLNRMLPSGVPDTSFGNGTGFIDLFVDGLDLRATALWMDADGGIVMGGDVYPDGTDTPGAKDSFIAVLNPDGSLDEAFGVGGMLVYPQSSSSETVSAVLRDAQGRIVLCGSALIGGDNAATLVRFSSGGDPDPGFGLIGLVAIDTPDLADDSCQAVAQHPADGGLVIATHRRFGSPTQQANRVYRVEDDGSYSATPPEFMTGAAAPAPIARMAIDDAGRIVIAGTAVAGGVPSLYITRLTSTLQPDTAFSNSGNARYPLTHDGSVRAAVRVFGLLHDAGRIVAATQYWNGDNAWPERWSLLRLQGDAVFGDGFE